MKQQITFTDTIDKVAWMQAIKYVTWGILAAAINDLCTVSHGIRYLLCV